MRSVAFGRRRTLLAPFLVLAFHATAIHAQTIAASAGHTNDYLNNDLVQLESAVEEAEQTVRSVPRTDPTAEQKFRAFRGVLQGLAAARAKVGDANGAIAAFSLMGQENQRLGFNLYKPSGNETADLAAIDAAHAEDAVR